MKQVLRSELDPSHVDQLKESRFVLFEPSQFSVPKILAHGNDPAVVSQGGIPVVLDELGKPTSPHVKHGTGNNSGTQFKLNRGELYRIDEQKRG